MSDTDESGVLVDVTESMDENNAPILSDEAEADHTDHARAVQIVKIGKADDDYAFDFDQEALQAILKKVPAGWKVAVVSVLGAFRTGKSFLLSWCLRYLHAMEQQRQGTISAATPWYETFDSIGNDGFDWRAGSERNTTGMWMWSQPYFMEKERDAAWPVALLLVDTQGMFDHETTMNLTASIFGFGTLLSSYQIYNVDKRIQEDHLQQLALFSEYARAAMTTHDGDEKKSKGASTAEAPKPSEETNDDNAKDEAAPSVSAPDASVLSAPALSTKPFQHIEFLVRDWQHFDDEVENDYDAMEASMEEYLEKAIAERDAKDLQETREQIMACFERISCFGLCHPGFPVTKTKFTGNVADMEPTFVKLLDRYCRRVFGSVQPKVIGGRALTAVELGSYVAAYAALFQSGAKFPTAATLLEATVSANNVNATHLALQHYKTCMDRVAGPRCSNYVRPDELQAEHAALVAAALREFDAVATFGGQAAIATSRDKLKEQMESQFETYESLNEGRNPLAGLETYVIPVTVAMLSWLLRWMFDITCTARSTVCAKSSEFLSNVYAVVFSFLAIVAATKAQQIHHILLRIKSAAQVLLDNNHAGPSSSSPHRKTH